MPDVQVVRAVVCWSGSGGGGSRWSGASEAGRLETQSSLPLTPDWPWDLGSGIICLCFLLSCKLEKCLSFEAEALVLLRLEEREEKNVVNRATDSEIWWDQGHDLGNPRPFPGASG